MQAVPRAGEMQPSGKETDSVYTQIPVQPAALVRENRKGHDSYTGFSLNIKWSEVFQSVPGLFSIVCLMARERSQVGEPWVWRCRTSRSGALTTGIVVCWAARAAALVSPRAASISASCPTTGTAQREELTLAGISRGGRQLRSYGQSITGPGWSCDCKQQTPPWLLAGKLTAHVPLSARFNTEEISCA